MSSTPQYLAECENSYTDFPFNLQVVDINNNTPAHRHNFVEFSYVLDGRGVEFINGVSHEMKPGTFSLLLPYQIHEIRVPKGSTLRFFNCSIALDVFFELNEISKGLSALLFREEELPPYCYLDENIMNQVEKTVTSMYQLFVRKNLRDKLLFRAKLIETLVMFDDTRKESNSSVSVAPIANKENIWRVLHYAHTNYREPLTLHTLAERFSYSVPYLSKSFKRHVGENFKRYLNQLRLRHACSLLVSTELPIVEVAIEVGFESYATFLRLFKDRYGSSPSIFRDLHKG